MVLDPKTGRDIKKYLTYGSLPTHPGFLQLWNTVCGICIDAFYHDRIPVLSKKICLPKLHNPAGEMQSSWDRYWDISELAIYQYTKSLFSNRIKFKRKVVLSILWVDDVEKWLSKRSHRVVIEGLTKEITGKLTQADILYINPSNNRMWLKPAPVATKEVSVRFFMIHILSSMKILISRTIRRIKAISKVKSIPKVYAKPPPEILAVVDDIVKQLGANFWAIHIRRNDVLKRPDLQHSVYASAMPWIVANLECARLSKNIPLFLMTDERDPLYLLPLQQKFNIIRASDFKSFQDITAKYPDDNFLRFHIERLIYFHAKRRYKTATHWSHKYEFLPFQEPIFFKKNCLSPHCPLPINSDKKYFSYLSLEGGFKHGEYQLFDRWQFFLSARYNFAQSMLHLRLDLRRRLEKMKI